MRIESDEGFVSLIAENEAEVELLPPIATALNKNNTEVPANIVDNLQNGPENRVINGILQIQIS